MAKYIIFDFDNTIADALALWVDAYNEVAPRYGYKQVTAENREYLRTKTAWQIKNALGVKLWSMPLARRAIRQLFSARVNQLQFVPGMREVLERLKAQGYTLGIFTSNKYDNVNTFLSQNGCREWFEFIDSEASLFFKSWQFKRMLRRRRLDPKSVTYIGDETKDIDAGRSAGTRTVAVTWGVNAKQSLLSHRADIVIERPEQLLEIHF